MINMRNNSNINTDKIMQVICLLPKEYTDMDVEVRIYGTRCSLLKVILDPRESSIGIIDFLLILRQGVLGAYSGEESNKIEIYVFNIPKSEKENTIQNFVFDLFHELRHKYQNQYMREFYDTEELKYRNPRNMKKTKEEIIEYINLGMEKDADEFALNFYSENQEKIDEIFGILDEYTIKHKEIE